jgi:membrane protein YdbS with pleckstrin-like domain
VAISSKLLNDGETVVVDTRTHVKALLMPLIALIALLAAAIFLARQVGDSADGKVGWAVWIIAALGAMFLVVIPFLNWLTASYTVTTRRLITRNGILTRRGHDIPLARISDVAYEHGLLDRMLGCGTLIISDASTNGSVQLHDIPRVEDTHRKINQLLNDLHHRNDGS